MLIKNLIKEAYIDAIKELEPQSKEELNNNDLLLGDVAAQLAQAKGELNTILDRAVREGILKKDKGRISILKKEEYMSKVGSLPKKIKALQNQLEPTTNATTHGEQI